METRMPVKVEAALVLGLKDYIGVRLAIPFNVTVIDLEYGCKMMQSVTYKLGGPKIIIPIEFSPAPTFDEKYLFQLIEPVVTNVAQEVGPSMIQYIPESHAYSIYGFDWSSIGSWKVGLRLGFKEHSEFHRICFREVNIIPDGATFYGDDVDDQEFYIGENFEMFLPTYTDRFGQAAQVSIDLKEAAEFLEYVPVLN